MWESYLTLLPKAVQDKTKSGSKAAKYGTLQIRYSTSIRFVARRVPEYVPTVPTYGYLSYKVLVLYLTYITYIALLYCAGLYK